MQARAVKGNFRFQCGLQRETRLGLFRSLHSPNSKGPIAQLTLCNDYETSGVKIAAQRVNTCIKTKKAARRRPLVCIFRDVA